MLEVADCEVFYEDTFTGKTLDKSEFRRMCGELQPGDTVAFTKLDRVARTETEAYELVMDWIKQGIRVHILNIRLLKDMPVGRVILHVMLAFAEFERDIIAERMQGGRANAPDYREGKPSAYTKKQRDHAMKLLREHSYTEVTEITGISKSTLQREAWSRGFRKTDMQA